MFTKEAMQRKNYFIVDNLYIVFPGVTHINYSNMNFCVLIAFCT